MARIVLVHATYETIGGGGVFSIALKRALESLGHEVVHVTMNPGRKGDMQRLLGEEGEFDEVLPRPLLEKLVAAVTRGRATKLRRLLLAKQEVRLAPRLLEKYNADLLVDSSSGYPIPLDIVYMHQPAIFALTRSRSPAAKLYLRLIMLAGRGVFGQPRIPLTNSTYTARLLVEIFPFLHGVRVLHPPVDYEYFSQASPDCSRKWAVTLTRIVRVKRLEALLAVAEKAPDWEIHLAGAVTTRDSRNYASWLEREARRRRLSNFHLHRNLSRRRILELFNKACAYIHPPFHEYFGIAVAEAMSAGLPPIVWREGGAWTDLVAPCCPQLGYRDPGEIPGRLEEAHARFSEYSRQARERASKFSYGEFREKLASIIDEALEGKGYH